MEAGEGVNSHAFDLGEDLEAAGRTLWASILADIGLAAMATPDTPESAGAARVFVAPLPCLSTPVRLRKVTGVWEESRLRDQFPQSSRRVASPTSSLVLPRAFFRCGVTGGTESRFNEELAFSVDRHTHPRSH